jgi:hypothetical protein
MSSTNDCSSSQRTLVVEKETLLKIGQSFKPKSEERDDVKVVRRLAYKAYALKKFKNVECEPKTLTTQEAGALVETGARGVYDYLNYNINLAFRFKTAVLTGILDTNAEALLKESEHQLNASLIASGTPEPKIKAAVANVYTRSLELYHIRNILIVGFESSPIHVSRQSQTNSYEEEIKYQLHMLSHRFKDVVNEKLNPDSDSLSSETAIENLKKLIFQYKNTVSTFADSAVDLRQRVATKVLVLYKTYGFSKEDTHVGAKRAQLNKLIEQFYNEIDTGDIVINQLQLTKHEPLLAIDDLSDTEESKGQRLLMKRQILKRISKAKNVALLADDISISEHPTTIAPSSEIPEEEPPPTVMEDHLGGLSLQEKQCLNTREDAGELRKNAIQEGAMVTEFKRISEEKVNGAEYLDRCDALLGSLQTDRENRGEREAQSILALRQQPRTRFNFENEGTIDRQATMGTSAKTTSRHFSRDAENASSFTRLSSTAGKFGAEHALSFIRKDTTVCPPSVKFSGRDTAEFQNEYARHNTEAVRHGEIPADYELQTFDKTVANDCKRALFTSLLSGVCASATSRTSDSDAASVAEICKSTTSPTPFEQDTPSLILFLLYPMISSSRFVSPTTWREIGRIAKSAYPTTPNVGIEVWTEMTAQKILIALLRKWAVSKGLASKNDMKDATDRKVMSWGFTKDGKGHKSFGQDPRPTPAKEVSSTYDAFDPFYEQNSLKMSRTEDFLSSVAEDAFGSRAFGIFSEVMPANVYKVDSNVRRTCSSFIRFREAYKDTMMNHHAQIVQRFYNSDKEDINIGYGSDEESVPTFLSGPSRPVPSDYLSEVDLSKHVTSQDVDNYAKSSTGGRKRRKVLENERIISDRRIRQGATPEDFEWGPLQESNCVHLFFTERREGNMSNAVKDTEKEIRQLVLNSSEVINQLFLAETKPFATDEQFGAFMLATSLCPSQEMLDMTVNIALDSIIKTHKIKKKCIKEWRKFGEEEPRVTIRTLGSFARDDTPCAYSVWHERWALASLVRAMDPNVKEYFIGEFAARILWQQYICVPKTSVGGGSTASWYVFKDGSHYLRPVNGSSEVSNDLSKYVSDIVFSCAERIGESEKSTRRKVKTLTKSNRIMEGDIDAFEAAADDLKSMKASLDDLKKMTSKDKGKESILKTMRGIPIMCITNFSKLENSSPYLVAFENGIVDTDDGKADTEKETTGSESDSDEEETLPIVFRKGKIEDFVTKSTNYNIPYGNMIKPVLKHIETRGSDVLEQYSMNHPDVLYLLEYMLKVFANDQDLMNFAFRDFSSFFYGRNKEKLLRVWSGGGNNSKTILVKIFQKFFGQYCFDMPAEAVATKQMRNASAPSPEMAQGDGARLGILAEPSTGMEIDAGIIKRMTGNDRIFTRRLNENGGSIEAMYKMVLCCNDVPNLSSLDTASRGRMIILPFLSTWVHDVGEMTASEQLAAKTFKMDINFDQNIPRLAKAMAWMLFHVFPEYKRIGIKDKPKVVEEVLSAYWRSNDTYLAFTSDAIERVMGAILPAQKLYERFGTWFAERNPGVKTPIFKDFETNMSRKEKLGEYKNATGVKLWAGVRIKDDGLIE